MPDLHMKKSTNRVKHYSWFGYLICILGVSFYFFPEYPLRLFFQQTIGKEDNEKLTINKIEDFNVADKKIIELKRNKKNYKLSPHAQYSITAKVGYAHPYDDIVKNTIDKLLKKKNKDVKDNNLTTANLFLLWGEMAKSDVFSLFNYKHKSGTGYLLCKGVSYEKSFAASFATQASKKEQEKYNLCNAYSLTGTFNNYRIIPANERINKAVHTLMKGDIIHIEGYLVDVPQLEITTAYKANKKNNGLLEGANLNQHYYLYTTKIISDGFIYK